MTDAKVSVAHGIALTGAAADPNPLKVSVAHAIALTGATADPNPVKISVGYTLALVREAPPWSVKRRVQNVNYF